MLTPGPAKKLTIYLDESERTHGKPVYEVLLDLFFKRKIAGASVFRGIEGYGSDRSSTPRRSLSYPRPCR